MCMYWHVQTLFIRFYLLENDGRVADRSSSRLTGLRRIISKGGRGGVQVQLKASQLTAQDILSENDPFVMLKGADGELLYQTETLKDVCLGIHVLTRLQ